jgi:bud site selection protein 31
MSKFARKGKQPAGFEYLEQTLEVLENELRDKINEPHEGKRRTESIWPVHQINWQRSRYVYDMHYKYGKVDKKVLDYCVRNKIVDGSLIAKWKKAGYERLCSTYVINTRNYNFGTVSICRVPPQSLGDDQVVECPTTGCRGCASGGQRNIFGNKYGQSLAKIQILREQREQREAAAAGAKRARDDDDDDAPPPPPGDDDDDVVGRSTKPTIWAADDDDRAYDDDGGDGAKRARPAEGIEKYV